MLFLADENFPLLSVRKLRNQGLDVTWISEGNFGIPDSEVLRIAENEGRIILTFDMDFGELVFKHKHKAASGIVLLRLVPGYPAEPADIIISLLGESSISLSNKFTVVERDYIRQRPLI
jgi:predicted nuclease of predicted toxin-antitoxin system